MASYGTDAYGAYFGHTLSTVVQIHLQDILAVCEQKDKNISVSCNMRL
jgi:hypothetical protein